MKVVFLDVDGVLNAGRRVNKGTMGFELIDWALPHAIVHINRITRVTGAKLVISSTWRIGKTIKELRQMFAEVGIEGDIVGKTERGPCSWHVNRGYPNCAEGHRGGEIADWLRNYKAINGEDIEAFVILDDDSDMGDLSDRHIKTAYDRGITRRECDRAIQMLGHSSTPA
jgi:hypothetical protein